MLFQVDFVVATFGSRSRLRNPISKSLFSSRPFPAEENPAARQAHARILYG